MKLACIKSGLIALATIAAFIIVSDRVYRSGECKGILQFVEHN